MLYLLPFRASTFWAAIFLASSNYADGPSPLWVPLLRLYRRVKTVWLALQHVLTCDMLIPRERGNPPAVFFLRKPFCWRFNAGSYWGDFTWLTPYSIVSWRTWVLTNLVPLFDMILLGMPNRQMILLQMKLASVALVSRRRVTIQSIWYSIWLRLGSICGP